MLSVFSHFLCAPLPGWAGGSHPDLVPDCDWLRRSHINELPFQTYYLQVIHGPRGLSLPSSISWYDSPRIREFYALNHHPFALFNVRRFAYGSRPRDIQDSLGGDLPRESGSRLVANTRADLYVAFLSRSQRLEEQASIRMLCSLGLSKVVSRQHRVDVSLSTFALLSTSFEILGHFVSR